MDRNRILTLAWLPLLLLFLPSCQRSASSPSPQPVQPIDQPSPTPGEIPFPLAPASTWIYEYRAYAEEAQAVWIVTETVIAIEKHEQALVAQVERIANQQEGQPSAEQFPITPKSGTFWYILRGNNLYRQTGQLDLQTLARNATLEIVFPPENIPCWPLNESELVPLQRGASGCRYLNSEIPSYKTPTGEFENCLEFVTPYLSGSTQTIFCPNIGLVAEEYHHIGSSYGYQWILTGYSLPLP